MAKYRVVVLRLKKIPIRPNNMKPSFAKKGYRKRKKYNISLKTEQERG